MSNHDPLYLCLADAHRARLLSGRIDRHQRCRLTEMDALALEIDDEDRQPPSPLRVKDDHAYAVLPERQEQHGRQFAEQVVAWLEHYLQRQPADVHLVAPARFLGELRKAGIRSSGNITEHEGDLTNLALWELAKRADVHQFLTPPA